MLPLEHHTRMVKQSSAAGGTRTLTQWIKSPLLCLSSYGGVCSLLTPPRLYFVMVHLVVG